MQSTSKWVSVMSVALVLGLVCLFGCAAPSEPGAADMQASAAAAPMTAEEIEGMLADADELYKGDEFAAARTMYASLVGQAALTDDQAETVQERLGRIDSILHEREISAEETAEAVAEAPAEPAEEEAELTPEMAAAKADETLSALEALCAERDFIRAAGQFEVLDGMREMLSPARKLDYDQLRMDFQAETHQLRALTEAEKEERAEEHLDYGVEAYKEGHLALAQEHLLMAKAYDVSIGWLDNRTLRRTLERVGERMQKAQDDYVAARQAFEFSEADEAEALLAALAADPAGLDETQAANVQQMLKAIQDEKAEAAAAAAAEAPEEAMPEEAPMAEAPEEAMPEEAPMAEAPEEAMPEEAPMAEAPEEAMPEEAPMAEAPEEAMPEEAPMAEAPEEAMPEEAPMAEAPEEAMPEEAPMAEAPEEAMPEEAPAPPMAEAEQEDPSDVAQALFDEGIEAYEAKQYAVARAKLDEAAGMNVSIGWIDNRKLRRVRAEVTEALETMLAGFDQGKRSFEAGEYAQAVAALEPLVEGGVNFGDPQTEEAATMLAASQEKIAEMQRQERQARIARAGEMLDGARALAGKGDYLGARAALDDLAAYDDVLTDRQRADAAALKESIQAAADVMSVEQKLAEAQKQAAEAEALLEVQKSLQGKVREADAAAGRGDYVTAQARLAEAEKILADADAASKPALADLQQLVADRAEAVRAAAEKQAHEQEVGRKIGALLDEATDLSQTDLLAAEKKVLQAKKEAEAEGVAMTVAQLERSNAVLAMVEAEYGVERRLRPDAYGRLTAVAAEVLAAGEPAEAVQILQIAGGAPDDMVSATYREEATDMLARAQQAVTAQAGVVEACEAILAEAKGNLGAGDLDAALTGVGAAVQKAREDGLGGTALTTVLEDASTLLEEDFGRAVADAQPAQKAVIDQLLAKARAAEAFRAGRFYLNNDSPALAEPYLRFLLDSPYAGQDVKDTARGALDSMPDLKAKAERDLLLAVKDQVDAVHSLAGQLNQAVKAGRVDEASALEARLADAQLALAAGKADALIARGAYSAAAKALDEAPADKATDAAVATYIAPVRSRLASLRRMATDLLAAEKALEAYNVDAAQQKLTAAASDAADSDLLAMKLELMGEVIDQVRAEQDKFMALTMRRDEVLETVSNMLAVARAREEAWNSFVAALTSFLKGEDAGVDAIQAVAADTSDLPPAAASLAADVGRELADWAGRPAADEARRVLRAAETSFAASDYVAAAALLKQLRGMKGADDPVVAAEADALAGRIAKVEEKAAALYAQAIAAYGRDDAEAVRSLLTELKSKYANTQAYREHM